MSRCRVESPSRHEVCRRSPRARKSPTPDTPPYGSNSMAPIPLGARVIGATKTRFSSSWFLHPTPMRVPFQSSKTSARPST